MPEGERIGKGIMMGKASTQSAWSNQLMVVTQTSLLVTSAASLPSSLMTMDQVGTLPPVAFDSIYVQQEQCRGPQGKVRKACNLQMTKLKPRKAKLASSDLHF